MIETFSINSFIEVQIKEKALIVLDIDDTILGFDGIDDKWWIDRINYYMGKSYDYKTADSMALTDWINFIKVNKPKLLDKINFLEFIKKSRDLNCEIVLLTARKKCYEEMTLQHVKDLDIDIDSDKIYFNENKGLELKSILNNRYPDFNKVIFIDDNIKNISNVKSFFENLKTTSSLDYELDLYKIYHYEK